MSSSVDISKNKMNPGRELNLNIKMTFENELRWQLQLLVSGSFSH
jgi:hypothetical protein